MLFALEVLHGVLLFRTTEEMHIGNRIKEVMKQQGRTVSWMVFQIHCERTNVYNIYKRKTIDTGLLVQISLILGHNFFADLADEIRKKRHEKTEM